LCLFVAEFIFLVGITQYDWPVRANDDDDDDVILISLATISIQLIIWKISSIIFILKE